MEEKKKKKVLVIEDNEDVRENLRELLELSGYEAEVAVDGKQGIIRAMQFRPDLVLCDVMMPELDGFGVLRIMSNKPELKRVPFIFLTAKNDLSDIRKGMNLGADDYITKPFDDVELLDAIAVRLRKNEELRQGADFLEKDRLLIEDIQYNKTVFLQKFADRQPKHYRRKEIIYEQDESLDFLYYIKKGKAKVTKVNEEGKSYIVNVLIEGDFFGYMDILSGGTSTETVIALEESEILQIPRDDFKRYIYNDHNAASAFIKFLALNLQDREDKLLHLAYDSVRRRVATALLVLWQKAQERGEPYIFVYRDDLAGFVGTAKETVIRTLSDFKEEGLINILEKGHIEVVDIQGLEDMPN